MATKLTDKQISDLERFSKAFKKRTGVEYQNWIQGWAVTKKLKE